MKSSRMMIVFLLLLSPSFLFANEQEVVARTQALRILGGDEVTDPSQFPWIVSLTYGCSGSQSYICSGVLLNSKIVMTAAHCSSECGEDQMMFGFASVGLSRLNVGQEVRSLEAWSVPLDYTGGTDNDIALWRLNEEFTTVDEFAQLPEMNLGVNEAAMVAGWGLTSNGGSIAENLMVAEIEIQPDGMFFFFFFFFSLFYFFFLFFLFFLLLLFSYPFPPPPQSSPLRNPLRSLRQHHPNLRRRRRQRKRYL